MISMIIIQQQKKNREILISLNKLNNYTIYHITLTFISTYNRKLKIKKKLIYIYIQDVYNFDKFNEKFIYIF